MKIKIKSLDQISAWLVGLVVSGIVFGIVWWMGSNAFQASEAKKVNAAESAEQTLQQARKEMEKKSKIDIAKTDKEVSVTNNSSTQSKSRFGYSGTEAPWRWSDLQPNWKLCSTGKAQSPIDIVGSRLDTKLKHLKFNYRHDTSTVDLANQTTHLTIPRGSWIEVDGERFDLTDAYIRTPSEHRVQGLPYEMEIQLQHEDLTGRLLFVSVLGTLGKNHSTIQNIADNLPRHDGESGAVSKLNWLDIIPDKKTYWTYTGSLSFPPCNEGVTWIVMTQTIATSKKTLNEFEGLQKNNARPVQALNKRALTRSNR